MNRYDSIEREVSLDGIRYIRNAIYPEIPVSEDDTYIKATGGDRYATFALQF